MPLEGFHSQVWLMLQGGIPVDEIAQHLGSDVEAVERALAEAEAQVRRDMANLRFEDFAAPVEFHSRPNPLVTRDGVEIGWQTVDAADAVATWDRLRVDFGTSGLWPVIVGRRRNFGLDEIARTMDDAVERTARPAADLLARAAAIDATDVTGLLHEFWADLEEYEEDDDFEGDDESPPVAPVEPIPSPLVGEAAGEVVVLRVPVERPEDVLAVIGWGDWNACPPPEFHVAVLRSWRDRYGAELRAISFDTLELVVARPPSDFVAALPLAREQFAYTEDIVYQGVHPSIGELAAALVGSARWHFWWD
jgi:hypothetical protein